jgi:hypothetical protein
MKLTEKQQEKVAEWTENGWQGLLDAIEWGNKSMWAAQTDSVAEVAGKLRLDLQNDKEWNGAKSWSQANRFIGQLERIGRE